MLSKKLWPIFSSLLALGLSTACMKEEIVETGSLPSPQDTRRVTVKWNEQVFSSPLNIKIDSDFFSDNAHPESMDAIKVLMDQMLAKWNSSHPHFTFFRYPAQVTQNPNFNNLEDYYDGVLGIYRSDAWFNDVSSNALAITQYFGHRRMQGTPFEYIELAHADILVNYQDFEFETETSTDANTSAYDLPSVLLHELGHLLGLPHQNDFSIASVMQPYLGAYTIQRDLYPNDLKSVQTNYQNNHLEIKNQSQEMLDPNAPSTTDDPSSSIVRGIIELRADGNCLHYSDGTLVHIHQFKK